jgi:Phage tail tube protein
MGYSSQVGQVIFRTQTVAGTYNADTGTAGISTKLRTGSLGATRELLVPDAEIGGGRDVADAYLGAITWAGDYEFYARYKSLPTLLAGALGEVSSAHTTGVVTDTITGRDTSIPRFLSIEETVSDMETFRYHDAVVNTFHLEAEANGYLMGTVGIIGARSTAGNTKTDDPPEDDSPMTVGTNILVTYNSVTLSAKSFSLDITNNYEDDDFRLGSFFIGDLTPKRREITASFGIRHSSSALWRQATYGTPGATAPGGIPTKQELVIACQSYEDIVGGTPTTKNSLTLTILKFMLSPFALEASGDDILENDVDGQAIRPSTATPVMTAVVKRAGSDTTVA